MLTSIRQGVEGHAGRLKKVGLFGLEIASLALVNMLESSDNAQRSPEVGVTRGLSLLRDLHKAVGRDSVVSARYGLAIDFASYNPDVDDFSAKIIGEGLETASQASVATIRLGKDGGISFGLDGQPPEVPLSEAAELDAQRIDRILDSTNSKLIFGVGRELRSAA